MERHMDGQRNINQLTLARPQLRTWSTTQASALTWNQTSDLLVRRMVLSPLSHTSQGLKTNSCQLNNRQEFGSA